MSSVVSTGAAEKRPSRTAYAKQPKILCFWPDENTVINGSVSLMDAEYLIHHYQAHTVFWFFICDCRCIPGLSQNKEVRKELISLGSCFVTKCWGTCLGRVKTMNAVSS
jgi:hypothetical protein